MHKIGITGGIGSGKTVVTRVFQTLGIPVFNADGAAKYIMHQDKEVIAQLTAYFGEAIYQEGRLNRPLLASIVFNDPQKLTYLNSIVHPKVIDFGNQWHEQQNAPYTLKEAALFFESGSYTSMDFIIGVTAPQELRLQRAMNRDGATKEQVLERMAQQMDEAEKMALCAYVIHNDNRQSVIQQVNNLHQHILELK